MAQLYVIFISMIPYIECLFDYVNGIIQLGYSKPL